MDQPGKVANPARGQLNRENNIPLSPCVPENLVSRDGFSRPVPRQPAHLHTQAESGANLRDSSRVPRRRPFMKPPYAIGSVPSLSGHAIAYRWRSLPRVRRHRASKPQGRCTGSGRDGELFGCLFFFKSAYFLQGSFLVQHGAVDIITLEGATITCDNTLSPA